MEKFLGWIFLLIFVFFFYFNILMADRFYYWEVTALVLSIIIGILIKKKILIGSWIGLLIFFIGLTIWGKTGPNENDLQEMAKPIHSAIKEYWIKHGSLPIKIEDIEIELPQTRYGTFRYVMDTDSYILTIGDYSKDGFTLVWKCNYSSCNSFKNT